MCTHINIKYSVVNFFKSRIRKTRWATVSVVKLPIRTSTSHIGILSSVHAYGHDFSFLLTQTTGDSGDDSNNLFYSSAL